MGQLAPKKRNSRVRLVSAPCLKPFRSRVRNSAKSLACLSGRQGDNNNREIGTSCSCTYSQKSSNELSVVLFRCCIGIRSRVKFGAVGKLHIATCDRLLTLHGFYRPYSQYARTDAHQRQYRACRLGYRPGAWLLLILAHPHPLTNSI